jgi:hypothetical protein
MAEWDREARLEDGRACLEAALRYLSLGWSVLPLCPPDHVGVGKDHARACGSPGKAPLVPWKSYQRKAATERDVRVWWRQWPTANVGLVMGAVSGLVGLDVEGEAGEAELRRLAGDDLPATLEFSTGRGRRLLYAVPPGQSLRITTEVLGDSQELRLLAEGAQTVAPPSRHPSGRQYHWTRVSP